MTSHKFFNRNINSKLVEEGIKPNSQKIHNNRNLTRSKNEPTYRVLILNKDFHQRFYKNVIKSELKNKSMRNKDSLIYDILYTFSKRFKNK